MAQLDEFALGRPDSHSTASPTSDVLHREFTQVDRLVDERRAQLAQRSDAFGLYRADTREFSTQTDRPPSPGLPPATRLAIATTVHLPADDAVTDDENSVQPRIHRALPVQFQ